jgi:hypothetical protein
MDSVVVPASPPMAECRHVHPIAGSPRLQHTPYSQKKKTTGTETKLNTLREKVLAQRGALAQMAQIVQGFNEGQMAKTDAVGWHNWHELAQNGLAISN